MGKASWWVQGVESIERLVARPLRYSIETDLFIVAVTGTERLRRQIAAHGERLSRPVLHAMNLPTGSDVTRLLQRIADSERRVRELSRELELAKQYPGDELRRAGRWD
jgi:hypothetical protein